MVARRDRPAAWPRPKARREMPARDFLPVGRIEGSGSVRGAAVVVVWEEDEFMWSRLVVVVRI